MAASSGRGLEEQLAEAGNKLLKPPSSVDELLPLLDEAESFLTKVEQSPAKSMHDALSPMIKALVADELLRHSDVDVKVALASCLSEITRITAPDAPYDDEKMKVVFQLIVSSFENLYDESSRSFSKRAMILETVSKVRLCVVMLDLECDALISDMYQHFLKAIREYHPDNIFSSMESIMILVLEESEDISMDLVTKLLDSVKKENEEIKPIGKRLAESVVAKCASKLKPYITHAVKSLGISLDEYSKVVSSVLQGTPVAAEHNNYTLKELSVLSPF
nr:neurofilament heavy polypeptide-like isoform X1 [Ipomoea batatas]